MKKYVVFVTVVLLSFVLGFLYYYFLRDNVIGFSWLGIDKGESLYLAWNNYFLWFPTFIHSFIFSLLTWWAMGFNYPKSSVLFWMTINLIAEIGQGIESNFFNRFPPILKNYFQRGTFDWWDMVSIIVGAILAYIFILKIEKEL